MEVVKDIAAIIGCILSAITLIGISTKTGRTLIANFFKKHTQELIEENKEQSSAIEEIDKQLKVMLEKFDALVEVSKQQCRDTIKDIYYKYQKEKKIPLYERKTADRTYEIYTTTFDGNSYASLLYGEICKWEIDTLSYQDLADE